MPRAKWIIKMLDDEVSDEVASQNIPDCPILSCVERGKRARCYFEVHRNCPIYEFEQYIQNNLNRNIYKG